MRELAPPTEAGQVLPPPKEFITEDQLDELWNLRGLKYRFDELHVALLSRGLNPSIDRERFRSNVLDVLRAFLVKGDARLDPRKAPRAKYPKVY